MEKLIKLLISFFVLLTGCSNHPVEESNISILVPTGAPALSLLEEYENDNVTINTVSGTDLLSAGFIKEESEYDMIIAPINLGCNLISQGKTSYRLKAILTWGNLYIVGTDDTLLSSSTDFAAFGEGAVPQKIFKIAYPNFNSNVTYYNAVNDVMARLVEGEDQVGLLAEPIATVTIQQAKQNNIELKVLADLQAEYQKAANSSYAGYPQAALFVKEGCEDKVSSLLERVEKFVNETSIQEPSKIESYVDKIGAQTLGVPNAKIAMNTWSRQNIHYHEATEKEADIEALLKHFNITFSQDMLSK